MIEPIVLVWLVGCLLMLHLKHFLMDFVYQNRYMLRKTNKHNWLLPLVTHSALHGAASFAALLIPAILMRQIVAVAILCLAEAISHLLIDGVKSRLFHYNVFQPRYWFVHGVDQMFHSFVYIGMSTFIAIIVVR